MSDAVHPCALDRLPREFRMYAHTSFSAPLPHCHVQDNSLLVAKKKKKKKSAELEKALRLAHHGRHLLKRGGKKIKLYVYVKILNISFQFYCLKKLDTSVALLFF